MGRGVGVLIRVTYRAVSVTAAFGSLTAVDGVCTRRPCQRIYLAGVA
jgi:hypothetical protein